MKILASITGTLFVLLLASAAQANDGAVPYINVTGVDPAGNALGTEVSFYGGQTGELFETLPMDYADSEFSRSIVFRSTKYEAYIVCYRDYTRPTTGEKRSDHKCSLGVTLRNLEQEAWGDEYNAFENNGYYVPPANTDLSVLGIDPGKLQFEGDFAHLFSFYGNQAKYMGSALEERPIELQSNSYKVILGCSQYYSHPFKKDQSGQPLILDDYKCDVLLTR